MKRWLLAAVAFPCAGLAQDMAPNGDMPPVLYRGDTISAVIFTSDVGAFCGRSDDPRRTIVACTFVSRGVIVMPNPCPLGDQELFAKIMCHENGHRQGWRH